MISQAGKTQTFPITSPDGTSERFGFSDGQNGCDGIEDSERCSDENDQPEALIVSTESQTQFRRYVRQDSTGEKVFVNVLWLYSGRLARKATPVQSRGTVWVDTDMVGS